MDNPKAVSISLTFPKGFKGGSEPRLAPSVELLTGYKHHLIDDAVYTQIYWDLIKQRGVTHQEILDKYLDGTIFTCWEGPSKFCHRHLLSQWLRSGQINIHELQ